MNTLIIFLDIDGVLNQLQGNYHLDNNCIRNLGILCNKLQATVVLISSWRLGYTNLCECSPQINDLKQRFEIYNIEITGRTKNLGNRSMEILKYIEDNKVMKYLILDDDETEYKQRPLHSTYIVNGKTGLTYNDVDIIVRAMERWGINNVAI